MKIQFQDGGGEVRSRIQMDNVLGVSPGYVARSLNRGLQHRGGGFDAREWDYGHDDEKTPDVLVNFSPELTQPPLTDDEVWRYAADLIGQLIED